jgi:pimeloyl-ACP methyl ester carboxylesterase
VVRVREREVGSPTGGRIEYLVTGAGAPATVFGHGLGSSIDETRPLGSGVRGLRAFLHFRGHGRSTGADGRWDYGALADDLLAVADAVGATRALGVSMGAGALVRVVATEPTRFDKVVLVSPATIDRPRADASLARFSRMADLGDARDVAALAALLLDDLPEDVRGTEQGRRYARERAARLVGTRVAEALRAVPGLAAVADRGALAAVRCDVLIVAAEGDPLHPVSVARELAAALPRARLKVFDEPGPMWHAPREIRAAVSGFLNG